MSLLLDHERCKGVYLIGFFENGTALAVAKNHPLTANVLEHLCPVIVPLVIVECSTQRHVLRNLASVCARRVRVAVLTSNSDCGTLGRQHLGQVHKWRRDDHL